MCHLDSIHALTLGTGFGWSTEGRVGSLIDDSGRFYKPLQDGERGDKEVNFYNTFWSDPNVSPSIQKFFPKFHGTTEIETPNGGGRVNILKNVRSYISFKRYYMLFEKLYLGFVLVQMLHCFHCFNFLGLGSLNLRSTTCYHGGSNS